MDRKGAATRRPRQRLLRLPSVDAAARRLEPLLSDEQKNLVDVAEAEASGIGNEFANDHVFDLDPRELSCAIVLFRPAEDSCAERARNWIIPILDGYGHVTHVSDEAFDVSERNGKFIAPRGKRFEDPQWRRHVRDLVDTLDVAVVDTTAITDEILWEIETCYRHVPSARVIVIAYAVSESDRLSHAEELSESLAARTVDTRPEPLLAYAENEGLGRFAEALHARMIDIVDGSAAIFESTLETAELDEDHPAMMEAYHGLGEASYNLGDNQLAMNWLRLALVMAEVIGDRAAIQNIHLHLQAAASAAGDDEQWLRSFEALGEIQGWRPPRME